jgi:hypothetical protein
MNIGDDSPVVTLDVRPLLAAGEEPFDVIMAAVAALPPDGILELTAPFEPVPLYAVLRAQRLRARVASVILVGVCRPLLSPTSPGHPDLTGIACRLQAASPGRMMFGPRRVVDRPPAAPEKNCARPQAPL